LHIKEQRGECNPNDRAVTRKKPKKKCVQNSPPIATIVIQHSECSAYARIRQIITTPPYKKPTHVWQTQKAARRHQALTFTSISLIYSHDTYLKNVSAAEEINTTRKISKRKN
jgi:hypothetical protein